LALFHNKITFGHSIFLIKYGNFKVRSPIAHYSTTAAHPENMQLAFFSEEHDT
jgi:hypothetical protein